MKLASPDLASATELCRTSEKDRLEYGKDAINTFKMRGVFPRLIMQHIKSIIKAPDSSLEAYTKASGGNKRVACVLWEENQRRLYEADPEHVPDYYNVPMLLDPEGEEVKAFLHYTHQNLAKNSRTLPRWDDWDKVFYESNGGQSELLPGFDIPKALRSLTTNYEAVKALFLKHKDEILEILETGNLVIVSNHCTWLNLPLIVAFLQETLDLPLDRINTILGGALTTQHAGFEVANASNLLKTVPDTPNGRLDDVAPNLQRSLGSKFMKFLLGRIKKNPGQIYIMSPSGTSDVREGDEINLLAPSSVTERLLSMLGKNCHILPLATNSEAIYAGQKIKTGAFNLSFSDIIKPGDDKNSFEALMHAVAELNPDKTVSMDNEEGESVGLFKARALQVLGTGNFGQALITALSANTAESALNVVGLSRKEAKICAERGFGETVIITVPSAEKEAILNYIETAKNSTVVLTSKGPAALEVYNELDDLTKERVMILSGPNIAKHIKNGEPSAAVIAGTNKERLEKLHADLNGSNLRLYISESPTVIQLSGVLKNLIVLELGKIWPQLGNDPKRKTEILMQALAAAYSVVEKQAPETENPEEFWGIAGLGDMLLCLEFFKNSEGSRNFKYGKGLAEGETKEAIVSRLGTIEGIPTSEGWHDESLEWLQTPEMNSLKAALMGEKESKKTEVQEDADHMKVFTRAFTVLEDACAEMSLNENTRAWAFCRLHKELQIVFPEDCKNEILHAMCNVVLSDSKSTPAEPFMLPSDVLVNEIPMLMGLARLSEGGRSIEALKIDLLGRRTQTEGFRAD